MKILVIGGMHGNEPLGIELVERLTKIPISGVEAVIANPKAKKINQRFTTTDLNRSFPGSNGSYEARRAEELLKLCKKFDLVLDFHNTHCPNNDCVFIGEEASSLLMDMASFINLKRVIVADYDCINKYATNCMSVEISLDSSRNNTNEWVRMLERLADTSTLTQVNNVEKYRFVYRITLDDKLRLGLDTTSLRAFTPINKKLATAMGVQSPAYPIFIDDAYTPYNYGGLLNKL
jgi:succinylglutamate desuccinylase